MQAKAVAFNVHSPTHASRPAHPALNIWQSLYHELRAAGYSKRQIAHWIQLSPRSVDRLLAGSTQQPSYKTLSRMLHAYCCHSLTEPPVEGGL